MEIKEEMKIIEEIKEMENSLILKLDYLKIFYNNLEIYKYNPYDYETRGIYEELIYEIDLIYTDIINLYEKLYNA